MAEYVKDIADRFELLKRKNVDRDKRMRDILSVRSGHSELVFDGLFPADWPKPIVANFIDVVASDTAEMVGVSPPSPPPVIPSWMSRSVPALTVSPRSRTSTRTPPGSVPACWWAQTG